MKTKNLMFLFCLLFTILAYPACGKKGNPKPPKEYSGNAVQSGTSDDFCE